MGIHSQPAHITSLLLTALLLSDRLCLLLLIAACCLLLGGAWCLVLGAWCLVLVGSCCLPELGDRPNSTSLGGVHFGSIAPCLGVTLEV